MHVVSYIQQSQDKTAKALHLAQHYRTVAENVRSESLKRQKEAEGKVEIVRNFWRNKIYEGSSRAGKIVQSALGLNKRLS